jgi:hypothetical protein
LPICLPALFVALALSVALAGCGGGGSGSGSSTPLSNAKTQLDSIITGNTPATAANVGNNAAKWQTLYNQQPNDKDYAVGYAISQAALAGETFDTTIGGPTPGFVRANAARAIKAHQAQLLQFGQLLAIWRFPSLAGSGAASWPQATDFTPLASGPSLGGSQIQAALAPLDQSLASVEQALLVPLSDPSYTFTIATPADKSGTQTLKLGAAEFDTLYMLVATLRGVINPLLAYNLSEPNYNGSTPISSLESIAPELETNGATITPAQYMAPSPFLTLNPNGATNMATAKTELLAAITHGTSAINEVEARNSSGYLIDPGTFFTEADLNQVKDQLTLYQTYVTGPFTANETNGDGQVVSTTIDVYAWFTAPPQDLKAFFPTFTVQAVVDSNSSTGYDTSLLLSPSAYPDLTFGGLFPNDFPTSNAESTLALGPFDAGTNAPLLYEMDDEAMIWIAPSTAYILYPYG